MWQKYELAEIWAPVWSALGLDQLPDGGDNVLSGPLQSGLVLSGFPDQYREAPRSESLRERAASGELSARNR